MLLPMIRCWRRHSVEAAFVFKRWSHDISFHESVSLSFGITSKGNLGPSHETGQFVGGIIPSIVTRSGSLCIGRIRDNWRTGWLRDIRTRLLMDPSGTTGTVTSPTCFPTLMRTLNLTKDLLHLIGRFLLHVTTEQSRKILIDLLFYIPISLALSWILIIPSWFTHDPFSIGAHYVWEACHQTIIIYIPCLIDRNFLVFQVVRLGWRLRSQGIQGICLIVLGIWLLLVNRYR